MSRYYAHYLLVLILLISSDKALAFVYNNYNSCSDKLENTQINPFTQAQIDGYSSQGFTLTVVNDRMGTSVYWMIGYRDRLNCAQGEISDFENCACYPPESSSAGGGSSSGGGQSSAGSQSSNGSNSSSPNNGGDSSQSGGGECTGGDCPDPSNSCPIPYLGEPPFCYLPDSPEDPENPNPDNPDPNEQPQAGDCPQGYTAGYVEGELTCVANSSVNDGQCSSPSQVYGQVNGVWGCHQIDFNVDDNGNLQQNNAENLNESASDLKAAAIALKDSASALNAADGSIKQNGQKLDGIKQGVDGIGDKIGEGNQTLSDISDKLGDPAHECDPTSVDYQYCLNQGEFTPINLDAQTNASNDYYARIANSPIVQALNLANYVQVNGGDRPVIEVTLPIEVGGDTVSTDVHCTSYAYISPYLTWLGSFLAFILAFRKFAES